MKPTPEKQGPVLSCRRRGSREEEANDYQLTTDLPIIAPPHSSRGGADRQASEGAMMIEHPVPVTPDPS